MFGANDTTTSLEALRLLDVAYRVDQPREAWLQCLIHAAARAFPCDAGVGGVLYDVSNDAHLHVDTIFGVNLPAGWLQAGLDMHRDPRLTRALITAYRSVRTSDCADLPDVSADSTRRRYFAQVDVGGQTIINGVDSSGKGCCLYFFDHRAAPLTASQRELCDHLATHLAAAYRLQRKIAVLYDEPRQQGESGALTNGPSAGASSTASPNVPTPANAADVADVADVAASIVKLPGADNAALPIAGAGGGRARKRTIRPTSAPWTLVGLYERDGERFAVARENAPSTSAAVGKLSYREQQVVALAALGRSNKLIAYELGVADSTVRVLVARASAKLRAKSRYELVARYRTMAHVHVLT